MLNQRNSLRELIVKTLYKKVNPTIKDKPVITYKEAASQLSLTIYQIKKVERRFFVKGMIGDDDDISIDLNKTDLEV
jgi:hypothetical protein